MARKTIAQDLEEKRVLIFNSQKEPVAPILATMGLDEPFLKKGMGLYNTTIDLLNAQKKEQQEESLAYDQYHEEKSECLSDLSDARSIIEMASHRDKNLQNRIKVNEPVSRRVEESIIQGMEFYNLVLNEPQLMERISKYGLNNKRLKQNIKQLENLRALRNTAKAEEGQAQEATRMRNEKMEELDDYCYELETIARIALSDKPQLLETLGILVRN